MTATLTAESGAVTVVGESVAFPRARVFVVGEGAYALEMAFCQSLLYLPPYLVIYRWKRVG